MKTKIYSKEEMITINKKREKYNTITDIFMVIIQILCVPLTLSVLWLIGLCMGIGIFISDNDIETIKQYPIGFMIELFCCIVFFYPLSLFIIHIQLYDFLCNLMIQKEFLIILTEEDIIKTCAICGTFFIESSEFCINCGIENPYYK